jgi:hypothetical protein
MRIQESRTFTMELSAEEFELLHPICKSVGYVYRFLVEENAYTMIVTDDMLYDMENLLKDERDYQYYEECNRNRAEEIGELINEIYYELNY